MSVEPPPPDWVRSDAAFHHRRSILDGEHRSTTRSSSRVVLESTPHASILEKPEHPAAHDRRPRLKPRQGPTPSHDAALRDALRRTWEELAFTTERRTQLLTLLGMLVVMALTVYGWQRGTLSGMATGISGERIATDTVPAAPRLRSDQVEWTDGDDESRRSTASFASDRAFADEADDGEPTSGAKLFVADGKKKSSKGAATSFSEGEATDYTNDRPSRNVESDAGSTDAAKVGSSARKQGATTTSATRFESCAQAAAAGAAPIRLGEPGYRLSLDADRDGVACENGSAPEAPGDGPVDSLYANPTTTTAKQNSGSTTSAASTGAGTTSTTQLTTTSKSSTTDSPTTTSASTGSSGVTSTTGRSTSSTSTVTTSTVTTTTVSTSPSSSSSSSTTSTATSTTATSTTTTSTPTTTTASTIASSTTTSTSSTTEVLPVDPSRFGRPV